MRILHVSTADVGGGAERIALSLHEHCRSLGHDSILAVGSLRGGTPGAVQIDGGRNRLLHAAPKYLEELTGRQGIFNPASRRLAELDADVVHCHNLHGGYFDLEALRLLAARAPVVLTLHDPWLMTGHCAHPFDCPKWQTRCGPCPYKRTYPRVLVDRTATNHLAKKRLFASLQVDVTAPSQWLLGMAKASLLGDQRLHHINNWVDHATFRPGPQDVARQRLGLPGDRKIVLFAANGGLDTPWRAGSLVLRALQALSEDPGVPPLTLVLLGGGEGQQSTGGRLQVLARPRASHAEMLLHYQAADVLAYPSKADTSPLTLLEAMACGLPIVASPVGGIPELLGEGRGMLVPLDVGAWQAALRERLMSPPSPQEAARGRDYVVREHDPMQQLMRFQRLYEALQ